MRDEVTRLYATLDQDSPLRAAVAIGREDDDELAGHEMVDLIEVFLEADGRAGVPNAINFLAGRRWYFNLAVQAFVLRAALEEQETAVDRPLDEEQPEEEGDEGPQSLAAEAEAAKAELRGEQEDHGLGSEIDAAGEGIDNEQEQVPAQSKGKAKGKGKKTGSAKQVGNPYADLP